MTTTTSATPLSVADFRSSPRRQRREFAVRGLFLTMAMLSIVISVAIVLSLVGQAWSFISQVDLGALWTDGWFPRSDFYDLRTLFVGTFIVTIIAMALAAPIGLGTAIYLSEYANPRARKVVKPILEVLAGVPSVVLGYFALTFVAPQFMQKIFSGSPQANLAVAGIGVGILTIPLVSSIAEDAMRAVPLALREASYGMGARKATTCLRVVIPASVSGLVAAFIIAISRAIGETMVVFIAAGGGNGAFLNWHPLKQGLTMTAAMATQASGTDAVAGSGLTFQSLFFVGFLLFLVTLALNLMANRIVARYQNRY